MQLLKNVKSVLKYQSGRLSIKSCKYLNKTYQKIWVVGTPRSGTTWLSNLINYSDKISYMFEPIHEYILKENAEYFVNIYLRSEENSESFTELFNKIFSHNLYHQRMFSNKLKFKYEGILVKDINANLAVKWVKNNFPDIKIIFLMRHPFAVTNSQILLSHWKWTDDPQYFFNQQKLNKDYLANLPDKLRNVKTEFEKKILIWCISNYVPLMQLEKNDCLFVFYENLSINPKEELKKIFSFLNINVPEHDKNKLFQKIKIPSPVSHNDSAIVNNKDLVNSWKHRLSSEEIKKGLEILKEFSLDKIYNKENMPNEEGLKEFFVK